MSRRTRLGAIVLGTGLLAVGLALSGGCQRQYSVHGEGDDRIVAVYSGTTLLADLPPQASVGSVLSAAEQVFRKRGYTIVEQRATEDKGMIAATPPGKAVIPRMLVRAKPTERGTQVELSYEPAGDRKLSESVLDAIMERLDIGRTAAVN